MSYDKADAAMTAVAAYDAGKRGDACPDHSPNRNGSYDRDSHDGCDTCAAYRQGRDSR